jgi:CBS domain-containing protein
MAYPHNTEGGMETMKDAIRAGMEADTAPPRKRPVLSAAEIMVRDLVLFRPDQPVHDAIALLLRNRISGGPVVDSTGLFVGTLSEGDCLRALATGSYDGDPSEAERLVGDLMNRCPPTISPDTDIFAIVQAFVRNDVRRLPVLVDGRVIGQVSRRDVLKAICADR